MPATPGVPVLARAPPRLVPVDELASVMVDPQRPPKERLRGGAVRPGIERDEEPVADDEPVVLGRRPLPEVAEVARGARGAEVVVARRRTRLGSERPPGRVVVVPELLRGPRAVGVVAEREHPVGVEVPDEASRPRISRVVRRDVARRHDHPGSGLGRDRQRQRQRRRQNPGTKRAPADRDPPSGDRGGHRVHPSAMRR
jgi:hypothetical protein